MERGFALVDVFTSEPFAGNPAGVVLDAEGLSARQMQSVAAEVGASETAFVLRATVPQAHIRIRWFTPTEEVRMCGHATIASVHALVESGRLAGLLDDPAAAIGIETLGGLLRARCERIQPAGERFLVWLDLVDPKLEPKRINIGELGKLLGVSSDMFDADLPMMTTQDEDMIVFVRDLPTLVMAAPDFRGLAAFCARERFRGLLLSTLNTPSKSVIVQSRFFAPAAGVDEDPVTGSVHGPLGVYLVANNLAPIHEHKAALTCIQGIPGGRTGLVRVMVTQRPGRGYSACIAGEAVTTIRGKMVC